MYQKNSVRLFGFKIIIYSKKEVFWNFRFFFAVISTHNKAQQTIINCERLLFCLKSGFRCEKCSDKPLTNYMANRLLPQIEVIFSWFYIESHIQCE